MKKIVLLLRHPSEKQQNSSLKPVRLLKPWSDSGKTYAEFLLDQQRERVRAERAQQERKRLEEEQKAQNAIHLESIKKSLDIIGIDKNKRIF